MSAGLRPRPPGPDPRIAVAEAWVCMLRALGEIGMRFACFVAYVTAPGEDRPKKDGPTRPMMAFRFFGDPVDAFNRVSRAVHLAFALALRIQDEIAALRAGKPLGPAAPAVKARRLAQEIREIGLEDLAEEIERPEQSESPRRDLNELVRAACEDPRFHRLSTAP